MDTNKYLLPVSVVLAGILIAGAVIWSNKNPQPLSGGEPQGEAADINNVNLKDHPSVGDPQAPVTIAFWTDFQCPFCKRFETETLPQIMTNYVDTGKARIVFFDYAFLGQASAMNAVYARAVWKLYPQKYVEWRTALYEGQLPENKASETENLAWLKQMTKSISGMDFSRLEADVAANRSTYIALVNGDREEGAKFGVNATPAFIIGKQLILGAYPYENFKAAIEAELE